MDYKNPDYVGIFQDRVANLIRIRKEPDKLPLLKAYYKEHPIQFITDWGCTLEQRNADIGQPVLIPFILFPRQLDLLEWILESWRMREPGVMPKSRDVGASWCAMALSCALGIFIDNFTAGFGSRKEEYVDNGDGDPKSLFYKGRRFLENLPQEFRGGYETKKHARDMLIQIPNTNSVLSGEAGKSIGRGNRVAIYFVDESAHLENPQATDTALSMTTNCRIDMSSVNGTDNPFYEKFSTWPQRRIFIFRWQDDPRKDQDWYLKKCSELNPLVVAQEIDLDWNASKEGVLIPSDWVQSAIDAHIKLNIKPTGAKTAALDVADKGVDLCAWSGRHGIVLQHLHAWTGKESDLFYTSQKAFNLADEGGYGGFRYDADGLGAGLRGDGRVINETRAANGQRKLEVIAFQGSGKVIDPTKEVIKGDNRYKGRTNENFFANRKAQGYWMLRLRFELTHRAVTTGCDYDPDMIISLDSTLAELRLLIGELSQPTYSINGAGKILVDKAPDGQKSPNYADTVMINYAPDKVSRGFF